MAKRFQVVIVGGGPVGVALAVQLGMRGISCALVETRTELGRIPKGQNLTHRTLEHFYFMGIVDELRAARFLPPGFAIGEITSYRDLNSPYWHAPAGRERCTTITSRRTTGCRSTRWRRCCAPRWRALPDVEARFGWTATKVEQDAARRARHHRRRTAETKCWRPITWSAATAAIRWCASRSAFRGAATTSTSSWCWSCSARASCTRGWQALSGEVDLPGDASGPQGLLEILRPDRRRRGLLLPCAGAEGHHAGQFRLPRPAARGGRVSSSRSSSTMSASGICASRSRRNTRSAACSSPATPRTAIRPMAASASTTAWRMRSISAGSSRRSSRAGAATRCCVLQRRAPADLQGGGGGFHRRAHPQRRRVPRALQPGRATRPSSSAAGRTQESDVGNRAQVYEPSYEGSPVVIGPPGGKSTAHGKHVFKARSRAPSGAAAAHVRAATCSRSWAAASRCWRSAWTTRRSGVRAGGGGAERAVQGRARHLRGRPDEI